MYLKKRFAKTRENIFLYVNEIFNNTKDFTKRCYITDSRINCLDFMERSGLVDKTNVVIRLNIPNLNYIWNAVDILLLFVRMSDGKISKKRRMRLSYKKNHNLKERMYDAGCNMNNCTNWNIYQKSNICCWTTISEKNGVNKMYYYSCLYEITLWISILGPVAPIVTALCLPALQIREFLWPSG